MQRSFHGYLIGAQCQAGCHGNQKRVLARMLPLWGPSWAPTGDKPMEQATQHQVMWHALTRSWKSRSTIIICSLCAKKKNWQDSRDTRH